ncbi:MAG: polysaccharide biosynthesis C-terminal domain-containing protein [Gammaproteobacteria bacterium]|nr:polysaccharide biosynthesis C-terminal domain-containing protein [Gammaproteobacteria bacterium]
MPTLRRTLSNRLASGLLWNFAALIPIGIGGFLINILVARIYGPEALGVFNQVLALYLVASQVCAGGFAFSTLRFAAMHAESERETSAMLATALILVSGISVAVGLILWIVAGPAGSWLESPAVATGLRWVAPGLIAFSLNKVLFAAINGMQRMRAYALGQAARFLLLLATLLVLIHEDAAWQLLPVLFTVGEFVLFVGLAVYLAPILRAGGRQARAGWWSRHLAFGVKAWPIGLLMDVNTKVDIVMLGYFMGDAAVGVYAFATLFVEALAQILVVVQNNLNPLFARFDAQVREAEIRRLIRATHRRFLPWFGGIAAAIVLVFPLLVEIIVGDAAFLEARGYLGVIGLGMLIAAGYLPFNMLLNQLGHPGWFSMFIGSTVIVNVILNGLLIPWLGGMGAAIATAFAFAAQVPLLKAFVRRATTLHI